jgi:hypothetical protein
MNAVAKDILFQKLSRRRSIVPDKLAINVVKEVKLQPG